ncbi:hypothetical protein BDZ91DRAFT_776726 [Kalaharituber pfeilii]|nr:hypothetical protein BDZ91DRAFT_776726 [Kalaharituber pfeilii]
MTELEEILARLGLSQYLGRLIEEGFERWETVLDITEQDLAALGFKLGHRRILQREIASARGVPVGQPLVQPQFASLEEPDEIEEKSSPKGFKGESSKPTPTGKRKYRRHPKPDEHAPEKPPSAYVMFANRVRDELKGQSLSFTDIAKLVGERWKVLDPDHKEEFEFAASVAKSKYNSELAEYKKTDNYKEYLQYLAEFKARTNKEGSGRSPSQSLNLILIRASLEPTDGYKRPKLENLQTGNGSSAGTTATLSNTGNGSGGMTTTSGIFNIPRPATATSAGRVGSISSVATTNTSSFPSPSGQSPLIHSSSLPQQSKPPVSPTSSPTPGMGRYRESLMKTTQEQQAENLMLHASHEIEPISLPRIHSPVMHNPHIQQQLSYSRHQPPPLNMPSSYPQRPSGPLQIPGQPVRRSTDESPSRSGSAPNPLPDEGRGNHHRALPLPPPAPQHSSSIGYFDQRPHISPSRSPRSHTYPPLLGPGPTQLVHSSSYPHLSSAISTPPSEGNNSSASTSGSDPSTTGSVPPLPPAPRSS